MEAFCAHCQLPMPDALVQKEDEALFCCAGCALASSLIHSLKSVHTDFSPEPPLPLEEDPYAMMAEPAFIELYSRSTSQGYREIDFLLEGVHCSACVWLLEKLPTLLDGVLHSRLQFRRSLLRLVWDPCRQSLQEIAFFLHRLGYRPQVYKEQECAKLLRREERQMLIRIGVAGAIAGNVMVIAFALYGGMFAHMASTHRQFFRWSSFLLTIPSVCWAARPFFRHAWAACRTQTLHMDLPIVVGILVGFVSGAWNTWTQQGDIYFDSLTILIFLLLVGRWLQHRQQRKAHEAIERLYHLTSVSARRVEDGSIQEVPISSLQEGDTIEVRAGELIVVDGDVVRGSSRVDLSVLTGEPYPLQINPGDTVHAGTLNLSRILQVRVTKSGQETRMGQILKQVQESSERRAPIVTLADKLSGAFVVVVFVSAIFTAVFWCCFAPEHAIARVTALLIVTCPCALGMATPLAIAAGLGRAARRDLLIKGGETLELLAQKGQIWFDKTGTLTEGKLALVEWEGDKALQPWISAMELHSTHPIAQAFCDAWPVQCGEEALAIRQVLGCGICGELQGGEIQIGAVGWIRRTCEPLPDWIEQRIEAWSARALTPVVVAVDRKATAVAGFGDPIRRDACDTLRYLRELGWKVGILSGDHPRVVEAVGQQLGFAQAQCLGHASPEEKRMIVEKTGEEGLVVMVGDGVNDSAALAVADVGISLHGGAEASLKNADIFLARPGLDGLCLLFDGARRTLRLIKGSLLLSLLYNCLSAYLAITGQISPLLAAILMPLSSLSVLGLSFRFPTFGEPPCPSFTSSSLSASSLPASL